MSRIKKLNCQYSINANILLWDCIQMRDVVVDIQVSGLGTCDAATIRLSYYISKLAAVMCVGSFMTSQFVDYLRVNFLFSIYAISTMLNHVMTFGIKCFHKI